MIIALEGGICSGKTTLANELKKLSFDLIPEYMDIITPQEEKEIDLNVQANRSAINVFLDIEKRRKEIYYPHKAKNIVLDRCYLTLFAYEYAISRDVSHVKKGILPQHIITPDLIVFLDVEDHIRKQRSQERKDLNMPDIFLQSNFNNKLKEFFLNQAEIPCVFFNTQLLPPEQMVQFISSLQCKDKTYQYSFDKYRHQR